MTVLAWSSEPVRHQLANKFLGLVVTKDVPKVGDEDPAPTQTFNTQWVHWDDVALLQGRFTMLDNDDGIVYRPALVTSSRGLVQLFAGCHDVTRLPEVSCWVGFIAALSQ